MEIIEVKRRPRKCPKCGGEICDIIYGYPTATWEEDHFRRYHHKAVLGGCCFEEDDPRWVCSECEQAFKLPTKEYLMEAYIKEREKRELDRKYWKKAMGSLGSVAYMYKTVHKVGTWNGMRAYAPILNMDYEHSCTGFPTIILVPEKGKAELIQDLKVMQIYEEIDREKRKRRKEIEK